MLELRPSCENCAKKLPNGSPEAMICNFECTFCKDCVENVLFNVCPNCGGDFTLRPTRPSKFLAKYPPSQKEVFKPIDAEKFEKLLGMFKDTPPHQR